MLGRLCHKAQRPRHALTYYRLALKLEPTLWGAFEGLCRLDPRLAGMAMSSSSENDDEEGGEEGQAATTAGVGEAHAVFGPLLPPPSSGVAASEPVAFAVGGGMGMGVHDQSMGE